jgi:hypothetical protein
VEEQGYKDIPKLRAGLGALKKVVDEKNLNIEKTF